MPRSGHTEVWIKCTQCLHLEGYIVPTRNAHALLPAVCELCGCDALVFADYEPPRRSA